MTLSFTQTINGKPNYFPQKIWKSLPGHIRVNFVEVCYTPYFNKYGKTIDMMDVPEPKLHTIRLDPHNRWRAGMNIHPVINNRTSNRFQFAPTIPCVSVQKIEIYITGTGLLRAALVYIDDDVFYDDLTGINRGIEQLAINDGFDNTDDFFAYFNKDFTGSMIHWTDLKY